MAFESENRFAPPATLVPVTFDHITARSPFEWTERALRLQFGENYHHHPLLHKGFVYSSEELDFGPWLLIQLGDSYSSGFLNGTEDENGVAQHHPHGKVISDLLSQVFGVKIPYIKRANGGDTLADTRKQLQDYEGLIPTDQMKLDREIIFSAAGNDAFNLLAHNHEFTDLMQGFIEKPWNMSRLRPIPTAFFERVNVITDELRLTLNAVLESPHIDQVKRLTYLLLPNAAYINRTEAYMENTHAGQRATIRAADCSNLTLVNHFYSTGSEIINAALINTLNDFCRENADKILFDLNVIDTFAVLGPQDFFGEHPTRAGQDKLAQHYLSRCFLEGEERSLADMLWLPHQDQRATVIAA